MQAKSTLTPAALAALTTSVEAPAVAAPRRLSRQERTLRFWNRVSVAVVALILVYMVGCLMLVEAPVDQPDLPGLMAGFGVAPLLGLLFAYLVTRTELTRR
jgi:hypothetical protein